MDEYVSSSSSPALGSNEKANMYIERKEMFNLMLIPLGYLYHYLSIELMLNSHCLTGFCYFELNYVHCDSSFSHMSVEWKEEGFMANGHMGQSCKGPDSIFLCKSQFLSLRAAVPPRRDLRLVCRLTYIQKIHLPKILLSTDCSRHSFKQYRKKVSKLPGQTHLFPEHYCKYPQTTNEGSLE